MMHSRILSLGLGLVIAAPRIVAALAAGDADTFYEAFNTAFLSNTGNDVFYVRGFNDPSPDGGWVGSLDIMGTIDVYERTGDPNVQSLISNLMETWLINNPTDGWNGDSYNDDLGWNSLGLVRAYQATWNSDFLAPAAYGLDLAYARGWDSLYDDGGIWEQQPSYVDPPRVPGKEALSNDSNGKAACLLYQATHNETYLDLCKQLYTWVETHLYDPATGALYTTDLQDGSIDTGISAYNEGTWIDFSNILYEITGNVSYYNNAVNTLNFARANITTDGVFSNSQSYLNTWADEVARGVGHLVRDHGLWDEYYTWMVQNADSIIANQMPGQNLTWNGWAEPTPSAQDNPGQLASQMVSAMAWLQYTPATQPSDIEGVHLIVNNATGLVIDSAGDYGWGNNVIQWGNNGGQNQQWLLTQNTIDTSWNIINLSTWLALDCPNGENASGLVMDQWFPFRNDNQRWWIDQQSDGTYKIWNKASSLALDGVGNNTNGATLVQNSWTGGPEQRWIIK